MTYKNTRRGFTLIELLVVVLIVGILAAVAVPQYQKAVYKSRAVEAMTMLRVISDAAEVYKLANGEYADDISKLDVEISEELISSNAAGAFEDKYSYECKAGGYCAARVNNENMPFFQFNQMNGGPKQGYRYCHLNNAQGAPKNDIAKSICQSMGVLDNDRSSGLNKYFVINSK